ncbi:hypothetical protein C347_00096 [Cryptococcus neoformans AD2-60a]|nr:hypothetical protein C353_06825 [Cryptococcus neoformans var. grubii AD1-83a]OWZ37405.1 hypothetical protein C347_00096 [Cryptococcus neoformans var. grubii AD2-60a]OWZ49906.1 hypothetical protein C368_06830 [Cryptococcus neoformans var. grubii 125.91]OXC81104.1 hypothetical protein C344_06686 [Cryptococcus neoformans var. grubii AD1-7a]OXG32992.1 hypothetical protein C359_06756 [Cryptococcus neoformans var. grubii Bt120]OXG41237.1 hypothetical protein C355_06821 [Cryptococcus neoformans va
MSADLQERFMMENWASIGPRGPSRYDNSRFSLTKSFGRLQADIPETRRGFNTLGVASSACIGVDSVPVPPLIIYQSAQLQKSWFKVREEGDRVVHQLAINTDSGGINSYAMYKWLEDVDYLASGPVKGNRSPADGSYHPAYRQSIGHVSFPQSPFP